MMMRLRWKLALGVAALLAAAFCVLHFGLPDFSGNAPVERSIASTVLGEAREYLVHLPASYGARAGQRFPVIYMLDGGAQSAHTADAVDLLSARGEFPVSIVVGVANAGAQGRDRDLTRLGVQLTQVLLPCRTTQPPACFRNVTLNPLPDSGSSMQLPSTIA